MATLIIKKDYTVGRYVFLDVHHTSDSNDGVKVFPEWFIIMKTIVPILDQMTDGELKRVFKNNNLNNVTYFIVPRSYYLDYVVRLLKGHLEGGKYYGLKDGQDDTSHNKSDKLPPSTNDLLNNIVKSSEEFDTTFIWPSTYANETNGTNKLDQDFKEATNLYLLGYKITGLNRQERWEIIEKKVLPKLDLKEIAYTIANNVRLRKRQKDGKRKFAYAIAEWEHDLKELKEKYYKSNFLWPHY